MLEEIHGVTAISTTFELNEERNFVENLSVLWTGRKDGCKLRLETALRRSCVTFIVILSGEFHVYSLRQVGEFWTEISVAIMILFNIFVTSSLGKSDYWFLTFRVFFQGYLCRSKNLFTKCKWGSPRFA